MGGKGRKQCKLMQILSAPIRILCKARDFYVKGMDNCANRVSCSSGIGCPSSAAVRLPKSFSLNNFPACDDEEFRQLLRSTSKKGARQTALQMSMLPRSYSVSVGKIGRIDEEEPCAFEEHVVQENLLYAGSRSQVVRRKIVYQY